MLSYSFSSMNLTAAWVGILLGCVSGAVQGLFFHDEHWLGGYGSWRRRMLRLAHISFFGVAFLNLAFVATVMIADYRIGGFTASCLFIAGAVGMPLICYLSAWRQPFRYCFAVPVACLTAAAVLV